MSTGTNAGADADGRLILPTENDSGRFAIREAMGRLLSGTPERVEPGRVSISALAEEAGVPRNHLNRQYADLRDHFVKVSRLQAHEERGLPVPAEKAEELRMTIDKQRENIKDIRENRRSWKHAAEVFIRKNQTLQVELKNAHRKIEVLDRRVARQQDQIEILLQDLRDVGGLATLREPD